MSIQNILNFYDNYLKTSSNNNLAFTNDSMKSSLAEKVSYIDTFWNSNEYLSQKQAELLKNAGNDSMKNGEYKKAIQHYKRAIEIKPDYADVYFNLARAYRSSGDIKSAISTYNRLLLLTPNDVEVLTYVGECYKELEQYNDSGRYYKKALEIDPKYDLARRSLLELDNLKLAKVNPELAQQQKVQYAEENIKKALALVMQHVSPDLTKNLHEINITFDVTNSLSGHQNIAQYENINKRIVVVEDYIWAAPEVIASYIVHEAVHAKDRDSYTSIKEEQDAYREAVKFWLAHNNGIKDPEMDYAASLYLINPENLDKKVEEIYSSREAGIPKYSPNHGISANYIQNLVSGFDKMKAYLESVLTGNSGAGNLQVSYDQGLLINHYR